MAHAEVRFSTFVIIFAGIIILFCAKFSCVKCSTLSELFYLRPCNDTRNVEDVLRSKVVKETHQITLSSCIFECSRDEACYHVVYRETANKCVYLSNEIEYSNQLFLQISMEANCFVLEKTNVLKCKNNGLPLQHICRCPRQWSGRYCELPVKPNCQNGAWKVVQTEDHSMLSSTLFDLKIKVVGNTVSESTFFTVPFMKTYSDGNYYIQGHNSWSMSSNGNVVDLVKPIRREFLFYSSKVVNKLRIIDIGLTGLQYKYTHNFNRTTGVLIMRKYLDPESHVYTKGTHGSLQNLVDGLSKGYRLHNREMGRVTFNIFKLQARYHATRTHIGAKDRSFIEPLYYWSANINLQSGTLSVLRTKVQDGRYISAGSGTRSDRCDLDTCWTRIYPVVGYERFVAVLKENILEGRAIRMIIDYSISTDVPAVTVTRSDVIAVLADHFDPFDNTLTSNSKITFGLFSTSNVLSTCLKSLSGFIIHNTSTKTEYYSVQWFVSTRNYEKVFCTDENRHITLGSKKAVLDMQNDGKDFRICVEYQSEDRDDWVWLCTGTSMTYTHHNEVFVQSYSFSRTRLDADGRLTGMSGNSSCDQSVWVFSTEGWVHEAVYNLGVGDITDTVRIVKARTVNWFVQPSL